MDTLNDHGTTSIIDIAYRDKHNIPLNRKQIKAKKNRELHPPVTGLKHKYYILNKENNK